MACLADRRRIELQCDLPCKPFRLYPDAPLAHLIGTQAKQGWDEGETSLDSPPILRLAAFASASPLANQKRKERDSTYQRRHAFVRLRISAFPRRALDPNEQRRACPLQPCPVSTRGPADTFLRKMAGNLKGTTLSSNMAGVALSVWCQRVVYSPIIYTKSVG